MLDGFYETYNIFKWNINRQKLNLTGTKNPNPSTNIENKTMEHETEKSFD